MVVSHNLLAMNSNRQFGITTKKQASLTEKLSSGYKINRSADDAAGLAISEKMRRQIRGLTQASSNCQDGISLIQTAEGGLNEVHDMIQRMNELSVKAANGTLTEADRDYINSEFSALKKEINRVAGTTTFNEIQLFPSDGSSVYTANYKIRVNSDGTHTMELLSDTYTVGETKFSDNAKAAGAYVADQIPAIMDQLKAKLPSLTGAEDLSIALDLSYIDGGNGTLAYASYSYYTNGDDGTVTPVKSSFLVKVDTADFTDNNYNGDRKDLLDATLRHELTHTIMQYNIPSMPSLPDWFVEGAAQVTGGGFSTGWLSEFENASTDADFQAALRKHTVDGQPYGMGFLATAYAAYKANGSGTVTADGLMSGLNTLLGDLKNGRSLEDTIKDRTSMTVSELKNALNSGSADAASFVKAYATASQKGDGTFGAGSALVGFQTGSATFGPVPADGSTASSLMAADTIALQVGSESGNQIDVGLFSIGTNSLGLSNADVLTQENAQKTIGNVKNALGVVSTIRSYYGAMQNRLEHTIKNLDNVVENTTAAESSIRDTDMASLMVQYANNNILAQAGTSMLAQANQSNQSVLSLLQG